MTRALALCLFCATVIACSNDEAAPFAPGSPSGDGGGFSRFEDGGKPKPDEDSGAAADEDAGATTAPGECAMVDPMEAAMEDLMPEERPSRITSPLDLKVTRAVAHWIGKCSNPVLEIKLSDGTCPNGDGHELVFQMPARSISKIKVGNNQVQAEPNEAGLSIRYTRPGDLDPQGTWGSCADVDGVLTLPTELNITAPNSRLRAQFTMTLTDCDGGDGTTQGPQKVDGSFNVLLNDGIRTYCPDWK